MHETWIIWALWFFFVLVQFGLAAWTVNPGDLTGMGVYGQIVGMVPAFHAILLFVLIPLLVFQESPVGTTACWLTRPMPRLTVLGSKLISFGILVLFPLLGQCAVLIAHHVTPGDAVLAGGEIALKELSWIALATGLAVLCPNFGVFLIAAAVLYVLQYSSGWVWNWLDSLWPSLSSSGPEPATFLEQSRTVASDLLCIVFGLGVVFIQYLTRRTRLAIAMAACGLLAAAMVMRYWPWDFVGYFSTTSAVPQGSFDASQLRFYADGNSGWEQVPDAQGKELVNLTGRFGVLGLPPEENLSLQSMGGEQTFSDGSKLELKPDPNLNSNRRVFNPWVNQEDNSSYYASDKAIGDLPILNQQFNANCEFAVPDLFTLDSKIYSQRQTDPGTAVFHLQGHASGYRITGEIPLHPGAFFSRFSNRTTLTEIFKDSDGVSLTLRERSLDLLLHPSRPEDEPQALYFLVNRKRSEALYAERAEKVPDNNNSSPNGLLSAFNLGDSRFEFFFTLHLSFNSQNSGDFGVFQGQRGFDDRNRELPVAIDDAWVAEAVLIRLEPDFHGNFISTVRVPDFTLDGHDADPWNDARPDGPDVEALKKVVLPAQPTRADVWRYITRILYLSSLQRNSNPDDPQVDLLARVGPEHAVHLLIAAVTCTGYGYPHLALASLDLTKQEEAKKMLFRLLPGHQDLLDLVTHNHWEADAKPILLARLIHRQAGEQIDDRWLDVLNVSRDDPKVKRAILDLLRSQPNVIRLVIGNHWEADAKPILIDVISKSRPGSQIDDQWIQVLDSFHDDSRVKAILLRALRYNQGTIETVIENHWEDDAKPVMLDVLNKAKPGDRIDDRWFRVLASLSDPSGVKEAVFRVLPFCQNAIITVTQENWETEALPVMLQTMAKITRPTNVDGRWYDALNNVADQKGVKEAILRILPFDQQALAVVMQNHWEAEAKPVLIGMLNKAKPDDRISGDLFQTLGAAPDQSGVKEAVLRVLPFSDGATEMVKQNHWEAEARPIVLATLAGAKPEDHFEKDFIGIAANAPEMPGVKEAILHVLPANDDAIDFVLQNHWEAEAKPILLRGIYSSAVNGQDVNDKWIYALAFLHDPATYPMLLRWEGENLNRNHNFSFLDDIRPLPASLVVPLITRAWNSTKGTVQEGNAFDPVAEWGITDALDRAAAILSKPAATGKEEDYRQRFLRERSHEVLNDHTPCPDRLLDADLAAWYKAHKAELGFDPGLGRYLFHPKPLSPDQSWPSATDTMKAFGERAAAGDTEAFDEIEATMDRATEGLDSKFDADKIHGIRDKLGNDAFSVLGNEVATDPGILKLLQEANRRPGLRPYIVDAYAEGAGAGNEAAFDALVHYQDSQWNLFDVVKSLAGLIRKGDPGALAFEENLPHDPNCTPAILNWAAYELRPPANAGNEEAQRAYRAVMKASGGA